MLGITLFAGFPSFERPKFVQKWQKTNPAHGRILVLRIVPLAVWGFLEKTKETIKAMKRNKKANSGRYLPSVHIGKFGVAHTLVLGRPDRRIAGGRIR